MLPAEVHPRVRQWVHHLDVAPRGSPKERRTILVLRRVVQIGALGEPPLDARQVLPQLVRDVAEGPRLRRLGVRLRLLQSPLASRAASSRDTRLDIARADDATAGPASVAAHAFGHVAETCFHVLALDTNYGFIIYTQV